MNSNTTQVLRLGDIVTRTMPFSEACMHMKVAGKVHSVLVTRDGAQILNHDGTKFSFEVALGEAGIYTDDCGRWYVPSHEVINYQAKPKTQVILFITRKMGERVIECSTQAAVDKCIDEYHGDLSCSYEKDEMGYRARVTLPLFETNIFNTAPAVRFSRRAKRLNIPAALED